MEAKEAYGETPVEVNAAKAYMRLVAQPILSPLIAALAVDQPQDVRSYIIQYLKADEESMQQSLPLCEVTGLKADFQVKHKDGRIACFVTDIFEAMKRKGKLRGCSCAPVGSPFPEEEQPEDAAPPVFDPPVNPVEERPVTPPNRGFKVTLPGQHYRDGQAPGPASKPRTLSFEPRALGSGEAESGASPGEMRERRIKAATARAEEAPTTGIERLLSVEQKKKLQEKQERDSLLGRIRAYYARIGGVEPFGLAAAPTSVLVDHLAKCKSATLKSQRDDHGRKEVPQKLQSLISGVPTSKESSKDKDTRVLNFAPRALGTAEPEGELTPEDRRRRALAAATKRLNS